MPINSHVLVNQNLNCLLNRIDHKFRMRDGSGVNLVHTTWGWGCSRMFLFLRCVSAAVRVWPPLINLVDSLRQYRRAAILPKAVTLWPKSSACCLQTMINHDKTHQPPEPRQGPQTLELKAILGIIFHLTSSCDSFTPSNLGYHFPGGANFVIALRFRIMREQWSHAREIICFPKSISTEAVKRKLTLLVLCFYI